MSDDASKMLDTKPAQNDFMNSKKKHIMELLDIKEDEFNHLLHNHDMEHLICRFSTVLFDIFNSASKFRWLSDVREHMGEAFYNCVIEGYVYGSHDT